MARCSSWWLDMLLDGLTCFKKSLFIYLFLFACTHLTPNSQHSVLSPTSFYLLNHVFVSSLTSYWGLPKLSWYTIFFPSIFWTIVWITSAWHNLFLFRDIKTGLPELMVNFVTSSYKPELLKPLVEKISAIPEVVCMTKSYFIYLKSN